MDRSSRRGRAFLTVKTVEKDELNVKKKGVTILWCYVLTAMAVKSTVF
jgi:hypothetical protein